MKKTLIILFITAFSIAGYAQESSKQRELGIGFANVNNFGITYKSGTETALWRINTLFANGYKDESLSDSLDRKYSSSGISIRLGREGRNKVADKIELRYGLDITFSYNNYSNESNDKRQNSNDQSNTSITYSPGIGLVFGFNYLLTDNFIIGAELLPSVSYDMGNQSTTQFNTTTTYKTSGYNYGISNTGALITLACRF